MLRLLMIAADDLLVRWIPAYSFQAHGIPTQVVVGQADLSACSAAVPQLVVDIETAAASARRKALQAKGC